MVNRIGNENVNALQSTDLLQTQQLQHVKDAQAASDAATSNLIDLFSDRTDISDGARSRLAKELEAAPFAQQARRQPESFDSDKVNYLKGLLDSGRLNEYWRNISNDDLADALLSSPTAAALR